MIPTEYRLEQVTARLAERLESTRRSFAGDAEKADEEFRRIAEEVVIDVILEFQDNGFTDQPARQEQLLRREVSETFLPRYTRMATAMTAREEAGYGLGFLYGPVGRLVIGAASLLAIFAVMRMPAPGIKFAMIPVLLSSVVVPDLVAWLVQRRYRKDLIAVFRDMAIIQDRSTDYVPTPIESKLGAVDPKLDAARRAAAKRKQRD